MRLMDKLSFSLPEFEPGWVWLTGAGPGDPGLLTLYALHGLRSADVVVYDALVDKSILELAKPGCLMEYAGKRGGKPSPKQADISQRLIKYAQEGKRVMRLKGGDPFVFGRGGEEALALVGAGISFRLVPGISAGIGGLAYAGIPVTHRDTNSAVTFVTGHNQGGVMPNDLDWGAIAQGSPVIVIYMAIKHLAQISGALVAKGRRPDEPVAVVSKASTPEQRVLVTTLGTCAEDVADHGIEPPSLVVVGEVVRLRDGLDWLGALSGRVLTSDPLQRGQDRATG